MSMMLLRRPSRWLSRWEMVNAGRRRIAKRSCSHASMSSARFIFLCTMENFTSGDWLATTCGRSQAAQNKDDRGSQGPDPITSKHIPVPLKTQTGITDGNTFPPAPSAYSNKDTLLPTPFRKDWLRQMHPENMDLMLLTTLETWLTTLKQRSAVTKLLRQPSVAEAG